LRAEICKTFLNFASANLVNRFEI